jgi:hypothetical protein
MTRSSRTVLVLLLITAISLAAGCAPKAAVKGIQIAAMVDSSPDWSSPEYDMLRFVWDIGQSTLQSSTLGRGEDFSKHDRTRYDNVKGCQHPHSSRGRPVFSSYGRAPSSMSMVHARGQRLPHGSTTSQLVSIGEDAGRHDCHDNRVSPCCRLQDADADRSGSFRPDVCRGFVRKWQHDDRVCSCSGVKGRRKPGCFHLGCLYPASPHQQRKSDMDTVRPGCRIRWFGPEPQPCTCWHTRLLYTFAREDSLHRHGGILANDNVAKENQYSPRRVPEAKAGQCFTTDSASPG